MAGRLARACALAGRMTPRVAWLRQLTGQPDPGPVATPARRSVRDRLLRWIDDLEGEMRRLAGRLGIDVPGDRWPLLVQAATFGQMKANAGRLAPDPAGIFKDRSVFFRRGTSGGGRELLSPEELAHYEARTASLAPSDLLTWLHRTSGSRQQ